MSYITLSPLKTGKGNNLKLRRADVEAAVKALNKYAQPLPATENGEAVAYEFAALTPAQQIGAITTDFTNRLTAREFSTHLKIARTNLGDLCVKLTAAAMSLGGDAQKEIEAVVARFSAILNPPAPEPKTKTKGTKGKVDEAPAQATAEAAAPAKPAAKPKTK